MITNINSIQTLGSFIPLLAAPSQCEKLGCEALSILSNTTHSWFVSIYFKNFEQMSNLTKIRINKIEHKLTASFANSDQCADHFGEFNLKDKVRNKYVD